MMSVGSLFSGIGGIDYGFEQTGYFKTKWFSETNKYACAVLRKHWPNIPNLGDITKINLENTPKVDVIVGGFPCQDVSVAGKRAGLKEGTRSGLWNFYATTIRQLRPKYAVIENVPGLFTRGFEKVLSDLAKIGYDAEWYCIPASAVGAPHRRDRIWIMAYPNHSGSGASGYEIDEIEPKTNTGWQEQSFFRIGRQREDVAYPQSEFSKRCESERNPRGKPERSTGNGSDDKNVADTSGRRFGTQKGEICTGGHSSINKNWWSVEPNVGRVAHGIPSRVDRIRCLGNAVVPQAAQIIAEAIKAYEESYEL